MRNKNKIGMLSLGCPRNLVDSEHILGRLNLKGYPIVEINEADVAIVNTCCFIEDAKKESIDAILDLVELKKEGRLKKVIVHGCMSQRYKDKLSKELPEVDAFVGQISLNPVRSKTPEATAAPKVATSNGVNHSPKRFPITPPHYAYLKICEGCINNCSFCVIPKIKGKFTSLNMNSIINRVEALDKEGISEINIIGQDITGYGIDLYGTYKLTEILKGIIKRSRSVGWIRLLYLYPDRITDELLALIRDEPKICKYIDLPIQHINERILKLMNRKTKTVDVLKLIEKVRKIIPGVALRTSIIVGFPSETDKEFKELFKFLEDIRFERLGAFVYSREEGTPAYNFKEQIPQKIKIERFNMIMSVQQKISESINKKFLDKTIDVLIDEIGLDYYLGRSQYDAPEVDGCVFVSPVRKYASGDMVFSNGVSPKRNLSIGDFVKVKITDTLEYDLVGELIR